MSEAEKELYFQSSVTCETIIMKNFISPSQKIGLMGENAACLFLKKQDYHLIERNVANLYGEIDIVAEKNSITYFFEVKSARKNPLITPAENLTRAKLKKFLRSVEYYCFKHRIKNYQLQAILVTINSEQDFEIEIFDLD